jgi:hypothetical protein
MRFLGGHQNIIIRVGVWSHLHYVVYTEVTNTTRASPSSSYINLLFPQCLRLVFKILPSLSSLPQATSYLCCRLFAFQALRKHSRTLRYPLFYSDTLSSAQNVFLQRWTRCWTWCWTRSWRQSAGHPPSWSVLLEPGHCAWSRCTSTLHDRCLCRSFCW